MGNFLDSLSETGYPQAVNEIEWLAGTILKTGKVSRDNLKETIESFGSRDELYLWLESLFDEAAIQISKGSGRSTAVMMEEAVDYIRSNYSDSNLGVNLLAERLGISTAYFGKLFNEFTGTKTLDYILKVRMEKRRSSFSENRIKASPRWRKRWAITTALILRRHLRNFMG